MHIGQRVEYATGIAESGISTVCRVNEETDLVTVKDEDDGSTWRGPADLVTPLDD